MRKFCSILYLPKDAEKWNVPTILANLKENPCAQDILIFSDGDYDLTGIVSRPEDFIKIPDPESRVRNTPERKFNVNNLIFLTALRIASLSKHSYTHMLYLETDVRVHSRNGKAWDAEIWDEFCALPGEPPIIAGSIAIRNPQSMDAEGQHRAAELTAKNTRPNFPISVRGSNSDTAPFLFCYGAGGIYDLAQMATLIPFENTVQTAQAIPAWDFFLGREIWKKFGNESFERIRNLESVFSGWGENVTTEAERREMLTSGRVVISHQHKNNWRPQ